MSTETQRDPLSAAVALVPDGYVWLVTNRHLCEASTDRRPYACVISPSWDEHAGENGIWRAHADTPAGALTDAAIAAHRSLS